MKRLLLALVLAFVTSIAGGGPASADGGQASRFDVNGNALDAHDGSLIQVGDTFYLYGTSYACGYRYQQNDQFCGFKAYSSPTSHTGPTAVTSPRRAPAATASARTWSTTPPPAAT